MSGIVSFLPSATEMVCALGLGDRLRGVTHECDYPAEARGKPVVVRAVLPIGRMSQAEIDAAVSERMRAGLSLYAVDEAAIQAIAPELILTQDLCAVCAPSGQEVSALLQQLATRPAVLSMSPHSIDGIFADVRRLGAATGREPAATALIDAAQARLRFVEEAARGLQRPRVVCLEWLDPPFGCGHWVPEMVGIAGGTEVLGRAGENSVRVSWDEIVRCAPEVLVIMPCGFTLAQTVARARCVFGYPGWDDLPAVRQGRVYAVDANAYFARPGPRVVDGTELLAHLLHPRHFGWSGGADAFRASARDNVAA